MTKVFYASTLFGAMTLGAAIDLGHFGPHDARRLLIVSTNVNAAEAYPSLDQLAGFAPLRDRFDDIVSWNELVAPLHPSDWSPRLIELPMLARLLADRLGLDEAPDELVVESVPVPPARSIAALLRDTPVTVYSDGLMSYGPTRDQLPILIGGRVDRLLHLDLVPDLKPVLLREWGVPAMPIEDAAFRTIVDATPAVVPVPEQARGAALLLGQYFSALGVLSVEEEDGLHEQMLRALHAQGQDRIVFKAHPAAGRTHVHHVQAIADRLGVELTVVTGNDPAELIFRDQPPALVVGCFSTALFTASRFYGIPVATAGTELLLERLAPYENSNRIPATIADAVLPRLLEDGRIVDPPPVQLQRLVDAVAYCMRATIYPPLRDGAAGYLADHGRERYFKKRRLEVLELIANPGARRKTPARVAAAAAPQLARRAVSVRDATLERIRRRTGE